MNVIMDEEALDQNELKKAIVALLDEGSYDFDVDRADDRITKTQMFIDEFDDPSEVDAIILEIATKSPARSYCWTHPKHPGERKAISFTRYSAIYKNNVYVKFYFEHNRTQEYLIVDIHHANEFF